MELKPVRSQDDFDTYDLKCLAFVFSICETNLENQFAERGEQPPEYVLAELHDLRNRLTRLLRKKVCS
jgi:hypothetical protein